MGGGCGKEFAMVTRTMLGGEQFGWGAVSGGLSTFSPHPLL